MIEISNRLQNMAGRIQRLWSIDSTSGVLAREQDDLGVDERPGSDTLVQGLAER